MSKKKKAKPTAGPWYARKGDVMNPERSWGIVRLLSKKECRAVDGNLKGFGSRSEVIAEVYATANGTDEADAYLLAAAPMMKSDIDNFIAAMDSLDPDDAHNEVAEIARDYLRLFRQSQAKAEGREK